ncbi:hypothetical protein ACFOEK_15700 [Litoribrevibacter euphylliae]|uniref:Uncharacterized protein n=1 Tax=Litoribrevibacter euphylliae TaxID=1834034 RepID=A0ABV7HF33_9GAMM
MRKKPDLIITLITLFVVGLLVSGLAKTASIEHETPGLMATSPDVSLEFPDDY